MTGTASSGRTPSRLFLHAAMFLSASLVTTSFTVGKAITPTLDPVVLSLVRFIVAIVLFAPYVAYKYGLARPSRRSMLGYVLISGALTGFFWLMFLALRITTPMNTSVLFTTVPGISGLFSWVLLRERLGAPRLLALVLAMTGALWVIFSGDIHQMLALRFNHGDLLFFGACVLMALYTPLVKIFHEGEHMAVMTFWILATGTLWLLLFALPRLGGVQWAAVPTSTWVGIVYLAIFTTIITIFNTQWATLYLGPTRVMAYSYLYPPLLVVLEWCLHRSLPPSSTFVGILIILPAMIVVQWQGHTHKAA